MAKGRGSIPTEKQERLNVILVMTLPPEQRHLLNDRVEEMIGLLDTAGCDVVAQASQHLAKPITSTYIGSGKIEEVAQLVEQHCADEVVFDCDLTPSQGRNLSKYIEVPIIDYSALILHIFAQNARKCGFAAPWRAPENNRAECILPQHLLHDTVFTQNLALADHPRKILWPHFIC